MLPAAPKSPQRAPDVQDAPRRKYIAPRLKRLGSVRDLTLGSAGGFTDGSISNAMAKP